MLKNSVITPCLPRNDSNQMHAHVQSECVRTSAVKSTSLSQEHRQRRHKIQVHTNQHPQVPTSRLVSCRTLLNTVPTHFAPDEIQRVATKHVFHQ